VTKIATDEEIAAIEAGLKGLPDGPWNYRPNEFDDWGIVRAADGSILANARAGDSLRESEAYKARCRQNGLDPYSDVGEHIARCSPETIRALVARLRAAENALSEAAD